MNNDTHKWAYPGSRWWRFDFHAHSPASTDADQSVSEEKWLQSAMRAGLDCVVVTDHNSGNWIDGVKAKYAELLELPPDWFRPLTVFPGLEITVGDSGGRVHLLGVFDPSCNTQTATSVLGACGIHAGFGDGRNTSTSKGFLDAVKAIHGATGIVIAAHVDKEKGLLYSVKNPQPELCKSLESVDAMEVCNRNAFDGASKELQKGIAKLGWVSGSDAHAADEIGTSACWIKMSTPSIEGLRLALMDHSYCLLHQEEDPNHLPDIFLTSLMIDTMSHCGRVPGQTFGMAFHPHFNAFIGGRGTGKSTALESIRIAARRDAELDTFPILKEKMDSFIRDETQIGVGGRTTNLLLSILAVALVDRQALKTLKRDRPDKEQRPSWHFC